MTLYRIPAHTLYPGRVAAASEVERVGRRAGEQPEHERARLPQQHEAEDEAEEVRADEEPDRGGRDVLDELALAERHLLLGVGRRDEPLRLGELPNVHHRERARDHVHRRRLERALARAEQQEQHRHRVELVVHVAVVPVDAAEQLPHPLEPKRRQLAPLDPAAQRAVRRLFLLGWAWVVGR